EDERPTSAKGRRLPPPPIEDEDAYEQMELDAQPRRSFAGLIRLAIAGVAILALAGLVMWQWPNMVSVYRSLRAPSSDVARETPSTPKKTQERIEPGSAQPGPAP